MTYPAPTTEIQNNKKPGIPLNRLAYLFLLMPIIAIFVFPSVSRATPSGAVAAAATGNADSGKVLFEKRCAGCHSLDQDKEGPRLRNVYGAKAGSVSTFKYSSALKSAQVTWNDASLEKWLTDPDSLVPDNDMAFHVPKADERADIIRFLRVASGK